MYINLRMTIFAILSIKERLFQDSDTIQWRNMMTSSSVFSFNDALERCTESMMMIWIIVNIEEKTHCRFDFNAEKKRILFCGENSDSIQFLTHDLNK